MPEYRVKWEIDLPAASPEAAAEEALRIHRDPGNTATIFEVQHEGVITVVDVEATGTTIMDVKEA